jgi:hypothetical protein
MYSPVVVAAAQARLESVLGEALPGGVLQRLPATQCHAMKTTLDRIWDPDKRQPTRPLSQEEQAFVLNEQLLTKIDFQYAAERYIWINYEGQALRPMYPLWESQRLILAEIARVEELHHGNGHPDGILGNILKGRQLGASTLCQSFLAHRVLTHGHVRTLIASDVPQNSGSEGLFGMLELVVEHWPWWLKPRERFHTKNQHYMWENDSRVVVESGKSMKGGLQDEGAEKGQIGRSKTYSCFHLSEITSWERPEQINSALLPAIPRTPRTFGMRESTAMGRHNYWHKEWLKAAGGKDPRFFNIFIPWYAESSKYWLPYPASWIPSADTLAFAARAADHGPRYMHRPVDLTKEQLYWYEVTKAAAVLDEALYKFLSEYPSEPEEAFQNSGRSIFTVATLDRMEKQTRPLTDLWIVAPRSDLIADAEASRREWLQTQAQMREARDKVQTQTQARVLTVNEPTPVRDELPAGRSRAGASRASGGEGGRLDATPEAADPGLRNPRPGPVGGPPPSARARLSGLWALLPGRRDARGAGSADGRGDLPVVHRDGLPGSHRGPSRGGALMRLAFPESRPFYAIPPGFGFHRLTLAELEERDHLFDTLQIWQHPRKNHRYVLGIDVSDGLGQDRSVCDVFRLATIEEPEEQVAQFISDSVPPRQFAGMIDAIGHLYTWPDGREALAAIECNNHGLSVQDTLQLHLGYRHFYIWEVLDQADPQKRFTTRMGWMTTPKTRPILLDQFYTGVTTIDPITGFSDCRINSPFTLDEMRDFQTQGALWEAEAAKGAYDDCIIAAGIAHYVAWRLMGGEREPLADRRRRRHEEGLRRLRAGDTSPSDFRNTDATAQDQKEQQAQAPDLLGEDQDDEHLYYDPSGRGYAGTLY